MSPSWISQPPDTNSVGDEKVSSSRKMSCFSLGSKKVWIFLCCGVILLLIAIGIGVGLGIGLTQHGSGSGSGSSTPLPPSNNTNTTSGTYWRPVAGESWQIVLSNPPTDTSLNVSVWDIDLFDNNASIIASLHGLNRKVICYFSAGSYEPDRPDSSQFQPGDKGKELDGWPGEYWLNTSSSNVRSLMSARLALAASKGCDGVDPDNVDGYDNDNGLDLTTSTALNYLTFLAIEAHGLNMAIGLKNAEALVNATVDFLQWEVNEQCVQYQECDFFRPFIDEDKPVFHIEYPSSAPTVSADQKSTACGDLSEQGFSTVIKEMSLNDWVEEC